MERRLLNLMFGLMLFMGGDTTAKTDEKYLNLSEVSDDGGENVLEPTVCLTEECVVTASDILESLDNDTDPCEDFYQFACGGWMKRQLLPPHRKYKEKLYDEDHHLATARNLVADKIKPDDLDSVKKAKILYASCIDYTKGDNDFESIVKVVKDTFGVWPLTSKEFKETDFSLPEFLSKAARLGVHPLFHLQVRLNFTKETTALVKFSHVLEFSKPTLGLPIQSYAKLFKDELNHQIYANKIYSDAERFDIRNSETAEEDALQIIEVETKLAAYYSQRQPQDDKFHYTLKQLDVINGQFFNCTEFVSDLASAPDIGITDIDSGERVWIQSSNRLQAAIEYFSQLPARTQANYIIWRVVDSLESVLIKEDFKIEAILKRTILGAAALPSPEESCVTYVSGVLPLVLHRLLYADQLLPGEIETFSRLLKNIQEEFDQLVDEHHWLDKKTTKLVKEKNAATALLLIDFERAMNRTFLDHFYANVTFKKEEFFQNVIAGRKEAFARNLRSLRKPYQRTADDLPHKMVAQHFYFGNQLEFTSLMFEPPVFINNVPMSVNYAGTGMIFGHEIVHGFDNIGNHYSKGVFGQWWNSRPLELFEKRTRCLVEQYNKYFYEKAGLYVDGHWTLSENIDDNAGVKLAYRAYKKYVARQKQEEKNFPGVSYTGEQVFFIRFAQNWCHVETDAAALWRLERDRHSPSRFRVIGPLQNSKDFPRVFNCPVGSGMNPKKKCEVW